MSRDRRDNTDPVLDAAFDALKPDDNGEGIVPPLDKVTERVRCRQILERHHDRLRRADGPLRARRWQIAAVSAGAALAIGTVLVFYHIRMVDSTPVSSSVTPATPAASAPSTPLASSVIPGSRIALLDGDVLLGDAAARLGGGVSGAERIRTGNGRTALRLPTGIGVGLSENTSARVVWDGKARYGISLQRGMALFSVDPRQAGYRDGFFVDTPAGTVHVKGTLFTVVVDEQNSVYVQLHRGALLVEETGGVPKVMTPGPLTHLGAEGDGLPGMAKNVLRQLQALGCMDMHDVFTELDALDCLVHPQPRAKEPGDEDEEKTAVAGGPGSPLGRQLTIKELMDLARSRKTGGDWRRAADAYRELIRHYPSSDEARTARVSLAQIQLHHLGAPRASLKQFSKYLTAPGPLAQEALYGKAEAYRAMGDSRAESRTLLDFLVTYPDGVYAASAKKRLETLRRGATSN